MRGPSTCSGCGRQWWPMGPTGRPPSKCDVCDPALALRRAAYHMRNARGFLLEKVLLDVASHAESIDPIHIDRLTLRRAVTDVAHAQGPFEMRRVLLDLATVCLVWASRLPVDAKDAAA